MSRGVQRLLTGCLIAGTAVVAVWGYEPDGGILPAGAEPVVERAFVLPDSDFFATPTGPVGAADCPDPGGPGRDPKPTSSTTEPPDTPPVTGHKAGCDPTTTTDPPNTTTTDPPTTTTDPPATTTSRPPTTSTTAPPTTTTDPPTTTTDPPATTTSRPPTTSTTAPPTTTTDPPRTTTTGGPATTTSRPSTTTTRAATTTTDPPATTTTRRETTTTRRATTTTTRERVRATTTTERRRSDDDDRPQQRRTTTTQRRRTTTTVQENPVVRRTPASTPARPVVTTRVPTRPAPVGAHTTDDLSGLDKPASPTRATTAPKAKAKAPAKKTTAKDEPKAKAARDKAKGKTRQPKEPKADEDHKSLDPLSKLLPPLKSPDLDGEDSDIERPDDIDGEASVVATSEGGGAGLTGAKALAALSVLALASAGGFAFWRKRKTDLDYWE